MGCITLRAFPHSIAEGLTSVCSRALNTTDSKRSHERNSYRLHTKDENIKTTQPSPGEAAGTCLAAATPAQCQCVKYLRPGYHVKTPWPASFLRQLGPLFEPKSPLLLILISCVYSPRPSGESGQLSRFSTKLTWVEYSLEPIRVRSHDKRLGSSRAPTLP